MRRYILLFLTLPILPHIVSAQPYPKYELYLNGGVSQPYYPTYLEDNWRWGFNGGVGLGYRLRPQLVLDGSVNFHFFRFDDVGYYNRLVETGYITTVDGKPSWVAAVTGGARYFLNLSSDDDTFLFFSGGIGVQQIHLGEIRVQYQSFEEGLVREDVSASRTNLGFQFHFGAGIDFVSSENRSYYFEVRYVIGFLGDYNSHFLPVKVGIRQIL